jgi:alkyl hydroperoxide reductase subunit AhpC
MSKSYGLWNEDRGTSNRAVIIVGKDGIVRFRKEYAAPTIPNPVDILAEVDKLG